MDRSQKLRHQFAEFLGGEDVEVRLAALAKAMQNAKEDVWQRGAALLALFPEFFSIVDQSYQEASQAKIISQDPKHSFEGISEANVELEKLNIAMEAMLDTLGQGLLAFDVHGICSDIYSKACLKLLETIPAGKTIGEVLRMDMATTEALTDLLDVMFSRKSLAFLDDYFNLFPKRFEHSQGLDIELGYRPILRSDGSLQFILVVATDRTSERKAHQLTVDHEMAAQRILRMTRSRNFFIHFFQSLQDYFRVHVHDIDERVSLETLRREIHTLRGNATIFILSDLASILHELELQLMHVETVEEAQKVLKQSATTIEKVQAAIREEAVRLFGHDFDGHGSMRVLPLAKLRDIGQELKRAHIDPVLMERYMKELMGEPIHTVLAHLDVSFQELANGRGIKVNPCTMTGENFLILTENYNDLLASLAHICRNVIAHAVDSPEARRRHGKPAALSLVIDTRTYVVGSEIWMRLSFTDDGGGIDVTKLRGKLKSKLPTSSVDMMTDQDVMQSIFMDNVSTSASVNKLSGLGVGLGAVREAVEKIGGKVRTESVLGQYTRIILDVPQRWI